jgi:hypothetical protein
MDTRKHNGDPHDTILLESFDATHDAIMAQNVLSGVVHARINHVRRRSHTSYVRTDTIITRRQEPRVDPVTVTQSLLVRSIK